MNEHQRSPQATNAPAQLPLVAPELLLAAIDALPKWDKVNVSKVTWVNWRQGFQIKMGWHSGAALQCYVDFGRDSVARDCVLARSWSWSTAFGSGYSIGAISVTITGVSAWMPMTCPPVRRASASA